MISSDSPAATIIKRLVFLSAMFALAFFYLFVSFQGLTSPEGMDQAQIGREIARGNGLTTKFVRPAAIAQLEREGKPLNINSFKDTFHAPLNPLIYAGVLKLTGASNPENFRMTDKNDVIYKLDRIIACTCLLFFVITIAINFTLIARIFDQTIASVVSILLLVSDLFWQFSMSGMPQMLMAALFSAAMYTCWRGIENQEAGRSPVIPAIISGSFFGLLALAHWITLWPFIGYLIFSAFYFRPRGTVSIALLFIVGIFVVFPLIYYSNTTGSFGGTAFYAMHDGMQNSNNVVYRSMEKPTVYIGEFATHIMATTIQQFTTVHSFLGSVILAPAFFLALIHPFKRSSIASFRWVIVLMWIFAAIGMSIYGVTADTPMDPSQIHLLFTPLAMAYGLAMISILWARLPMSQINGFAGNLHYTSIIALSIIPLTLSLLPRIKRAFAISGAGFTTVPYYNPNALNTRLNGWTKENAIIVSDQPWAVAWYADRTSIWLPKSMAEFNSIENTASNFGNPVEGVLMTPYSYGQDNVTTMSANYQDFFPLVYAFWTGVATDSYFTYPPKQSFSKFRSDYSTPLYLVKSPSNYLLASMVYFSRSAPEEEPQP